MEKILLSNNKVLDLDSWYGQIEYIEHALQGRSSNVLSVWAKLKSNLASKKDTEIIINHALSMGNDTSKKLQQKITELENKLKIAEETLSFYANKETWDYEDAPTDNYGYKTCVNYTSICNVDDKEKFGEVNEYGRDIPEYVGGKRARQALAKIRE